MRTVLHVDMNSYFATAEQQANPYLRGKPVGIVKAKGRGCVIAASIEAKKYGVKTGCTVWEAKELCPKIILVPSDMDKYFSLTEGLIRIVSDYSPDVEIFSIDEMFLDITDSQKCFAGGVIEIVYEMKRRIKEELGEWMKCSIGISFSKLIAKLASEMDKPDGFTWLTPEDYLVKTDRISVEEVCGIGYARTKWLHARGAYTLGQARKMELPEEIRALVWLELSEPLVTIEDLEPAKSVSRTFTTFREYDKQEDIRKLTRNLVEEATAKLREMNMVGRTLWLGLGEYWGRRTIKTPTDDPKIIFDLIWQDYEKRPVISIRQAGVGVSNLSFNIQEPMFGKRVELIKAADTVNGKWGLFTIYPATLLGGLLIRPEVTGYLGDKWYRFRKD